MRERCERKSISGIAALILLVMFASAILSVLLSGIDIYKHLADQHTASYDVRTGMQYLANKVRQAPHPNSVELSSFGDGDSLVICEQIDEDEYQTQIYCLDGWLMELFTAADAGFEPVDGEKILTIENLLLSVDDGLLKISITDSNGNAASLLLCLRGERRYNNEE